MQRLALVVLSVAAATGAAHAQPYPARGASAPPGSESSSGPYNAPSSRTGGDGSGERGGYQRSDQSGYDPSPQAGYASGQGASQGQGQAPPDLRRALRLRPDQQAAYRAYQAQIVPDRAELQRQRADTERMATSPTPQRLDMIARQLQRDQTDFARRADVVRRFYATLTPQQQRAFDVATAPPTQDQGGDGLQSVPPGSGGYGEPGAQPGGYPPPGDSGR